MHFAVRQTTWAVPTTCLFFFCVLKQSFLLRNPTQSYRDHAVVSKIIEDTLYIPANKVTLKYVATQMNFWAINIMIMCSRYMVQI